MPKIVFTGGGSAGHVTLNLALIPWFIKNGWEVSYIGSHNGMEKELVKKFKEVKYYSITTGKLRRYFSWQNFIDMIKIPFGCIEACLLVHKINPDIIFSKGGFVSFPVVIGGFINKKKIFMHESDLTPGLANKMSLPFVNTFYTTFPETIKSIKQKNIVKCIGPALSDRLFNGSKEEGAKFTNLSKDLPTIMIIGGSLGAKSLNQAVENNFEKLLQSYQIIHIAGKNGFNPSLKSPKYAQFEYVDAELKHLMALSDVVISRAGSNSIFELATLNKPMILVPLPNTSSRGEQTLNAKSFQAKGFGEIIKDEDITNKDILLPLLKKVFENKETYIKNMQSSPVKTTSIEELAQEISQQK